MAAIEVLHVDDEADMRLLVKLSLDLDTGISTRSAASGLEALDATTSWRPDVILLDSLMPGMDGLATLRALQANPKTSGIPVLFLTGQCSPCEVASLKAGGSAGVISKPFEPRALAAAVRTYVQAEAHAPSPGPDVSAPEFAGRTAPGVGASAPLRLGALSAGSATTWSAMGLTTQALLLDGNGNAFALSITAQPAGQAGTNLGRVMGMSGADDGSGAARSASSTVTVQAVALPAATVATLLGLDGTAPLMSGALDPTIMPGTLSPAVDVNYGHASGCCPLSAGATERVSVSPAAYPDPARSYDSTPQASNWHLALTPHTSLH